MNDYAIGRPKGADDAQQCDLSTIEHELWTPLTVIRSATEILRDHPDLSDSMRRRLLDAVLEESGRLAATITRVLIPAVGDKLRRDCADDGPGGVPMMRAL